MEYNNGRITKEAEKMNEVKKENKKAKDVNNVREAADNITDQLDEQALANFELNLQVNKYRSELRHALMQLDEHTYCPNEVDINCDPKGCNHNKREANPNPSEEVHGADCHCSKCCPNPNPGFLKKNKFVILLGVLWAAIIILALGWTPSGAMYDAMQNSWVELIVNVFKMGLFAIAGIVTYNLIKDKDEKADK